MSTILVGINPFGREFNEDQIPKLLELIQDDSTSGDSELGITVMVLKSYFGSEAKVLTTEDLVRFSKMSKAQEGPGVLPVGHMILDERIIPTLSSAKKLATRSNYLASIALTGYVAEVLAVLVWEVKFLPKYGAATMGAIDSCAHLTQSMRVKLLSSHGCISGGAKGRFNSINSRRNDVLHPWGQSMSEDKLEDMAIGNFVDAHNLLHSLLDIKLATAGSVSIDSDFLKILQ